MKIDLIFGVFILFAFAAIGNANLIKKPGDINVTVKVKNALKKITGKIPEPIVLSDRNIQQNTENLELDVTLSGSISGIQNLIVDEFIVSILGGISIRSFQFTLPKLTVDIVSYDLDGKLGLTHLFGKGQIFVNLENIVLKGSAKLRIFKKDDGVQYAQISSITADLSLDKDTFDFKITGWLYDEIRSEFMSNLIKGFVKNISPEFKDMIDVQLSSILTTLVADFTIPTSALLKP